MLFQGLKILRQEQIEVAFFSTTAFMIFLLGPIWKSFLRLQLVYDIQDPWYQGKPFPYSPETAPGSWRKYRAMQFLARFFEPIVMKQANQIIAVSNGYIGQIRKRYSIPASRCTLLPFPGAVEDFSLALNVRQKVFDPADGRIHWVYAGRGGPDMTPVVSALFRALRKLIDDRPSLRHNLLIHFVGTNYAADDRSFKVIEPIAIEEMVQDIVVEHAQRLPYLEIIDLYKTADAVLLLGSSSADYTASKAVNCVLARRPLFVLFHEKSAIWEVLAGSTSLFGCSYSDAAEEMIDEIKVQLTRLYDCPVETTIDNLAPWLAYENARIQCQVFDKALKYDT